jgi:alkanesulfonate monooxygenase SsuD/methylene tetrahydromethanopterin reductase-like flavin-dependent oxidoreductase (luciferase family)
VSGGNSPLAGLKHGIAVPNFSTEPGDLIELGVATEQAGFDGYFLWDHIVFSDTGDGPPIVDPWLVLSVVAAKTSRIRIGTVVTPVPRRRPWQLARTTTTLDRLSNGRVVLGVGLGSPAYGDFGIFHEPSRDRERAELLDEGLDVLAGLWSGETFSYAGKHLTVDPVRFTPVPVQRPRIPVWVAGVLPAPRPIARRSVGRDGADQVRRQRTSAAIAGGDRLRHTADHGDQGRRGTLRSGRLGRGGQRASRASRTGKPLRRRWRDLVDRDGAAGLRLVGGRSSASRRRSGDSQPRQCQTRLTTAASRSRVHRR